MSSALEKIKVMERLVRSGQLDTSVTRRVQLFRVSTIHEMVAMRVLMEDESGLAQRRNEFVENPWGFPYVPVPRFRRANTAGLRLAPEHISFEWFGHPIYWIDPELTRFREEEKRPHSLGYQDVLPDDCRRPYAQGRGPHSLGERYSCSWHQLH